MELKKSQQDPRKLIKESTIGGLAGFLNDTFRKKQMEHEFLKQLFHELDLEKKVRIFEKLDPDLRLMIVQTLASEDVKWLVNHLSPDDRTALFEKAPREMFPQLLSLLSQSKKKETFRLLSYPEESIGRLMTTRFIAVKPNWKCKEVIDHIRKQGNESETIYRIYVVTDDMKLLDDLDIRDILLADPEDKIADLMQGEFETMNAHADQEAAIRVFKETDRSVLPVTDFDGILVGIVTVDDLLDVMEQEETEDIQKIGGSEFLEGAYLTLSIKQLIKKRGGWLVLLFFGELLTASAMAYFEEEIQRAVVLSFFIPLIIASGGNSGAQAATIITRSLALGEIKFTNWWQVVKREFLTGLSIGVVLGTIGFLRILLWAVLFGMYEDYWVLIGLTIGFSLILIVLWGTLVGSSLPIVLQRLGFDPATSSAPFVATIVDVTGIIIYFSLAYFILKDVFF